MMKTAILLAVALALTLVAAPVASADPIYECVSEPKFTGSRACVVISEDCITAGGRVGPIWFIGRCP